MGLSIKAGHGSFFPPDGGAHAAGRPRHFLRGTYVTDHPTRVATVGIGYADGYLRSLAHKGARVMVDGVSCPLLGRVTMDQIIVDVSRAPHAEPGMTAEIMGPHIPVTELAEKAGTISWEIFTGIGPRVPRHYNY